MNGIAMSGEFRKRVTYALATYIDSDNTHKDEFGLTERNIKQALMLLQEEGIETAEGITGMLLNYDVVLPKTVIEKWIDELKAMKPKK